MSASENLPKRLTEIVEEFALCEGREKLELLLHYAHDLPPLPARLAAQRDSLEAVPECMTPVFMHTEMTDGQVVFYLDVPEEAPTVRGYASIIWQGLNQTAPAQVMAVPVDFYQQMGLQQVLSGQRLNGIRAILGRLKHYAQKHL
jgi:cysteine desulfuration protein SufE